MFPIFTLQFWKQLKFHLSLLSTRMLKRKTEKLGSLSKSKKVIQNRLDSSGRAAYGSVRNLSKASRLSKKRVQQFFKPRHRKQKLVPKLDVSDGFKLLQNISMKFAVWNWHLWKN